MNHDERIILEIPVTLGSEIGCKLELKKLLLIIFMTENAHIGVSQINLRYLKFKQYQYIIIWQAILQSISSVLIG